ncbi:addiction module toxin, RelE/StbE family [Aequorivita sublithincola DSM 14238]|uniref:Addiction module toxin, RelE/StbE family n=1 Tax=Aequorivita sublithincola (strain DSM 14238 / LMG 21431 / ACAM 643 / 9-3) TaxID=746697 RepID=I3YTH6_AEQSU|nr:type II toxin-antitoxin system RelE/ParE family toxin [Aequorivita sublithincola]AFL80294.1 addiction module toxin, RelE/StbE family [Aequorivita sublithincola DSM 14238]
MTYKVSIKKSAVKILNKIQEPYYSSIKSSILQLGENPRPQGYIKLKGREAYRIRISDYRIIYEIFDNELIVDVVALGHRKDIY